MNAPGGGVALDQPLEVAGVELERRARPVLPEVAQVRAHRVRIAVDQLLGEIEAMERLVPELALGLGG